jgi:hypothetical protein
MKTKKQKIYETSEASFIRLQLKTLVQEEKKEKEEEEAKKEFLNKVLDGVFGEEMLTYKKS